MASTDRRLCISRVEEIELIDIMSQQSRIFSKRPSVDSVEVVQSTGNGERVATKRPPWALSRALE